MLWVDDANSNIETVARHDGDGHLYDAMTYGYHTDANGRKLRNRPYNIQDLADQAGDYAQDIPQMAYQPNGIVDPQDVNHTINSANNFSYDELGQRTRDRKADIELIEWTVSGKMKRVHHTAASGNPDITFAYDAAGNRIMKQVGDPDVDPATGYREHYVLDAQGNIMAIYRSQPEPVANTSPQQYAASLKVTERPVYGSKRLGSYTRAMQLVGEQNITVYPYVQPMQAPLKHYELTDHLGNVATVVTGRLLPMIGLGAQYQAEVVSASLHEPFGLELTGMNWHSDVSRFGFQSQIKDLELNAIHFKYREYFPSDGTFPTPDPLWAKYPWNSPYAFSENRVIDGIELEGLEFMKSPGMFAFSNDGQRSVRKAFIPPAYKQLGITKYDQVMKQVGQHLSIEKTLNAEDGRTGGALTLAQGIAQIGSSFGREPNAVSAAAQDAIQQDSYVNQSINLVNAADGIGLIPTAFKGDSRFMNDLSSYLYDSSRPMGGDAKNNAYSSVIQMLGKELFDNRSEVLNGSYTRDSGPGNFSVDMPMGLDRPSLGHATWHGESKLDGAVRRFNEAPESKTFRKDVVKSSER